MKSYKKVLISTMLMVFLASGYCYAGFAAQGTDENHEPPSRLGINVPKLIPLGDRNSGISKKYKEDEILVKFKTETSEKGKKNLHKKHGSEKIKEFAPLRIHHVRIKKGMSVENAIKLYKADPDVEYAEPNFIYKSLGIPNDPQYSQLWGMAKINAPAAWEVTTGSNQAVVAVIDTGFDYAHEDLAANIWVNSGEIAGNGIDDDENGYVDDLYGIDTANHDGDPIDDHGHGTHVAGTIGAIGNNGVGVVGANWEVKIIGCKFIDSGDSGTTDGAVECLQYIKALKDKGVNIVATNNSWGGGEYSQSLYDAINVQMQNDILFIAAAGNSTKDNDTTDSYPANYDLPNLIAVAATDSADDQASFSNYGKRTVHVSSPGVAILSTLPAQNNWSITGGYGNLSGTSMATPHVTGLAALLKSQVLNRDWKTVKNLILAGGDRIPSMNDITITGKRINANGSLNCANSPTFSILNHPSTVTVGTAVTLSALSINCSSSTGPVTVTLSGGEVVSLRDDGISPDLASGDGIFTGTWTPSREVERLTFSSPFGDESIVIPPLSISPYMREGNLRAPYYDYTLTAGGGLPPYSWSIVSGSLPAGLSLEEATGRITGQVTTTGQFPLTVQATDSFNVPTTKKVLLNIVDDPAIEAWVKAYTHPGKKDFIPANAVDSSGNIYVTGESPSEDFLTIKYDSNGTVLWQKTFDRGGIDTSFAVVVDRADNVYVGGWSLDIMTGGADGMIIKYDSSGTMLWMRVPPPGCLAKSLAVDSDNNLYVTGGSNTVKYDSSGNLLWVKAFPDILQYGRTASHVRVDNGNNVYVTGIVWKYFENEDYLEHNTTLKYDADGNEIWRRTFNTGEGGTLNPLSMALDREKGYLYIVGTYTNTPGMIKYDLEGNFQWFRPEGAALDIDVDTDGNIYLSSIYRYEQNYDFSVTTRKYDANFNLLWTKRFETLKSDVPYSLAADKTGNVYVTGWAQEKELGFFTIKYSGSDSLTIAESPLPYGLPNGMVGSSYGHALTAVGGKAPYTWAISSGSLPEGLTLDSATGVISGIPASGGACVSFTVQVTDSQAVSARKHFSLCVRFIEITTSSLPYGTTGAPYSQTLTVSGGEAPYWWSIALDNLPYGLSLNPVTGEISGTATSDGTFFFYIDVRDANGLTTQKTLSITIHAPLNIITPSLPEGYAGATYKGQPLRATGGKTPYSWSISSGSLPPGLSLDISTGVISGSPTAAGIFDFTVQVQDVIGHASTKAISLYISPSFIVTPLVNVQYSIESIWPRLSQPWYFASPNAIAVDPSGNVHVVDYHHRIQKFDANGTYLTEWGSHGSGNGEFQYPGGIAFDLSGNVYVSDTNNHRIQKFDANGTYLTQWGSYGLSDGQFNYPYGIAFDLSGNVYVSDTSNHRIQKFDASGSYLAQWGSYGSGNGQLYNPKGIVLDVYGNVYVADSGNNRIQKFDANGTYLAQWGSYGSDHGQFDHPCGITLDASGKIHVSEMNNHRIQIFDSDGNFLNQLGGSGSGNGQFNSPRGMAVNASGNVYVADLGNNRIQEFNANGSYLTQWASYGTGNGQFNSPGGIAVALSGNVYVADTGNKRIQKFNSSGVYQTQWGSVGYGNGNFAYPPPEGIAVDSSGNVYVVDTGNQRIQKFDASGEYLTQWGSYGSGNGQFVFPNSIAVALSGDVYVAETGNNRIQKFNASGSYLTQWGTAGSGNGQFANPQGLAVDESGNVYVADTSNHRIQKFNASGTYLTKWGSAGSSNGQFNNPQGITADAEGNLYVVDTNNHRIQIFDSSGTYLSQFGSQGTDNGKFYFPGSISVDASGNLYIADSYNSRIQKLNRSVGGRLSPSTPQSVAYNDQTSFSAIPDTGYLTVSVDGCGGTLSDSSFTTGPITTDCTVAATFASNTNSVTPSAGYGGSLTPPTPQTINHNATTSFTVTPNAGYHIVAISGCGGVFVGTQPINASYSYTTGPILSDCTVTAIFSNMPSITTPSLLFGTVGASYDQTLTTTNGAAPYSWSITTGNLPNGLSLNTLTGVISGIPATVGTFNVTVQVMDANATMNAKIITITIHPQACSSSPIRIKRTPGVNYSRIQTVYDNASDGDTIEGLAYEFTENLNFTQNVSITLKGGYDCNYTENNWYTVIDGTLTISRGAVVIDNIVLK